MNKLFSRQTRQSASIVARIKGRQREALLGSSSPSVEAMMPLSRSYSGGHDLSSIWPQWIQKRYSSERKSAADPYGSESEISKQQRPTPRHRRRLSDVLKGRPGIQTFPISGNVGDAIDHLARQGIGCTIAVNPESGHVAGLFTARDILRFVSAKKVEMKQKGGSQSKNLTSAIMKLKIHDLVTPPESFITCSPDNATTQCRRLMFEHKIRHVPIIEDGVITGIVNSGDLSDIYFSDEIGGKRAFLDRLGVGMKGLPRGTVALSSIESKKALNQTERPLLQQTDGSKDDSDASSVAPKPVPLYGIVTSEYAMPHPFKTPEGCANSMRQYGARDLCTDLDLCEDAHFSLTVKGSVVPGAEGSSNPQHTHTYLCVADGVGSWRQYGVDPRLFAHNLVKNAYSVIESDEKQRLLMMETSGLGDLALFDPEPILPVDVIMDAWSETRREKISGSSTICVASLNNETNQLNLSNIGDSGLMVLRHMDSETAGSYMRDRHTTPRDTRQNDLRIAFLSQQQLKSFNLPYQLGFSDIPEHGGNFETPTDANNHSMTVLPGDIIVLATDGLFDNLDLNDLVSHIHDWEDEWFGKMWLKYPLDKQMGLEGNNKDKEAMNALAKSIVVKARELSLDKTKDSPFALLAKDNDIMWSGGMPDDTTVVLARVTTEPPDEI